ncbi:nuclear apoptosis-inducing factor 1-like [Saccostrea cucullata]|uniref:nuclear apoptosis-inducing factor 1-like n=1 Tax=Saccostrea cuccullata TaxID=36930 RepID=UPI002ED614A6
MESTDLCSKPKRARSTNFSIMEISTIHNEVKQNSILESKHSNTVTNQKKQSVWKSITEKVNAVGTAHRTVTEVKDKWRNMCRDAKQKFAEHKRESKKTGGGPPPTPLSQTVSDIVDLYKDSSSFVGIPGGIETSICDQTGIWQVRANCNLQELDQIHVLLNKESLQFQAIVPLTM